MFSNDKSAIVLDIDETIVSSSIYDITKSYPTNLNYAILELMMLTEDGIIWQDIISFIRPYLREFLIFCKKKFDYVCIWTAGTKEYANEIVHNLFPYEPELVWSRNKIDLTDDGVRYKDISKIRTELQDKYHCGVNVLMVDDIEINCTNSDYKFVIEKFIRSSVNDKQLLTLEKYIETI